RVRVGNIGSLKFEVQVGGTGSGKDPHRIPGEAELLHDLGAYETRGTGAEDFHESFVPEHGCRRYSRPNGSGEERFRPQSGGRSVFVAAAFRRADISAHWPIVRASLGEAAIAPAMGRSADFLRIAGILRQR